MKKTVKLILLVFLTCNSFVYSQFGYDIYGSTFGVNNINNAVCGEVDSCFTLTPDALGQIGAVWDNKLINLNYGFDASFCMYLGDTDYLGADGFAFVMRAVGSDSIGMPGSGLGHVGITPSLAIEFDTWENDGQPVNDIPADHTGLYFNGDFLNPAVSATPLLPNSGNVEDNAYHVARIVWNPSFQILQMYFDGNLRFTYFGNIVTQVFGGQTQVIWGFTASTGGVSNLQQICFPKYSISLDDVYGCEGDSVAVHFYNQNMTSYTWTDENGTVIKDWNTLDYPGPFNLNDTIFYTSTAGTYHLDIEINNQLVQDSLEVILIPLPAEPFSSRYATHCFEEGSKNLNALNPGDTYLWGSGQNSQQINVSSPGTYHVKITEPQANCVTRDTIELINFCEDTIICEGTPAFLNFYHDNLTSYTWTSESGVVITDWNNLDFSSPFDENDTLQTVTSGGKYFIDFAINGEHVLDTAMVTVVPIPEKPFDETALTACMEEETILLDAAYSNGFYLWSTGDSLQTYTATEAGTYWVQITDSLQLCSNSDTIKINSVCQTIVSFPNVFTPNENDQTNNNYTLSLSNDFKWISDFEFVITNRWGQVVYEAKNQLPSWDGKVGGNEVSAGVYFYYCKYTDVYTQEHQEKHGFIQVVK